jgi:hypothetical protein
MAYKFCCPVLELVVSRQARQGIRWGLMVNFQTGKSHNELIIEFPRGKDRKAEFANTTYSPLSFCPFCGECLIDRDAKRKASKKKAVTA